MADRTYSLTHRDKLLRDIAAGLKALDRRVTVQIPAVKVTFHQGDAVVREFFSIVWALEAVAEDRCEDAEGSWKDADRATVGI